MSYQALYRKYRPTLFTEVYGQDVVKKTLLNAFKTKKISHAYLFSGPRGTGKTSIAKLFAKTVNCSDIKDGNPCLHCRSCLEILSKDCTDIIEIDAASNNGVDEIRELRNNVSLVPSSLKYKVYIIDEVHMLSIGAFNALLKTLEEPPSHVIFILATTDLHKVPITIVSRCQCFQFKRISDNEIVNRLNEIVAIEDIKIDEKVLCAIASYADGGMRDALGMLDKLISYSSDYITMEHMHEINGLISKEEIGLFIDKVMMSDNLFVLEKINYLYQNGKDMVRFVEEIILNLRDQLVSRYIDNNLTVNISFVNKFALMLNNLLSELKVSNNIKILLEIEILQFINNGIDNIDDAKQENTLFEQMFENEIKSFENNTTENKKSVLPIVQNVEKKLDEVESIQKLPNDCRNELISPDDSFFDHNLNLLKSLRISNTFALATKSDLLKIKENWNKLVDFSLDSEIGSVVCFLTDATVVAASSKNLILTFSYSSLVERGNSMLEKIENTIYKIYSNKLNVIVLSDEEWEEEKRIYIENKNKGIIYMYVEEVQDDNAIDIEKTISVVEDKDLVSTAIQLFGKNMVKINE